MKRVYTADNVPMAWHIKNILEGQGVSCLVKNDRLYSVAGEIPITECMPEVWVKDSLYARYAEEIIEQAQSDQVEDEGDWKCLICEETNFSNFGACWSCGAQIKE
tara:strand:- start:826 stop:1140 length:315 start_codon:yes stop_codon:yes gene_type:complete